MKARSYIGTLFGSRWFAPSAMVALAVLAFGLPAYGFGDRADPSVSDEALHRLKTQATAGYKLQPLYRQVTEAHMTGASPDDVEGTVIWRTLFGIPVGQRYDINTGRWVGVWSAFAVAELALGYITLRQLAHDQ